MPAGRLVSPSSSSEPSHVIVDIHTVVCEVDSTLHVMLPCAVSRGPSPPWTIVVGNDHDLPGWNSTANSCGGPAALAPSLRSGAGAPRRSAAGEPRGPDYAQGGARAGSRWGWLRDWPPVFVRAPRAPGARGAACAGAAGRRGQRLPLPAGRAVAVDQVLPDRGPR